MTNIDTIREAYKNKDPYHDTDDAKAFSQSVSDYSYSVAAMNFYYGYLAALSTIDPEVKPQEPSEDMHDLAERMSQIAIKSYTRDDISGKGIDDIAALMQAHDDAIRQEERNRAEDVVCAYWPDEEFIRAAILGEEAVK